MSIPPPPPAVKLPSSEVIEVFSPFSRSEFLGFSWVLYIVNEFELTNPNPARHLKQRRKVVGIMCFSFLANNTYIKYLEQKKRVVAAFFTQFSCYTQNGCLNFVMLFQDLKKPYFLNPFLFLPLGNILPFTLFFLTCYPLQYKRFQFFHHIKLRRADF